MAENFIDYVKLYIKSGRGGKGSSHFRREKFVDKGGPDGGDGGRGGHVILKANKQMWTLLPLKYKKHVKADHGVNGSKSRSTGAQGNDCYLEVPLGTVAKNAETGEVMAEVLEEGQEVILLEGGKGGLGNSHFKSSTKQTPDYAQPGEPLKEAVIILELKVLADVGLVGFPNAGKSTLLSVISAAKPEIANYAFTTLTPNLGVVAYKDYQSFVMADIPGLIEGASKGKGLGTRFLRHIERNAILLFVIDGSNLKVKEEYDILINELKTYNPELLDKNRIIGISKSELLDEELKEELKKPFDSKKDELIFFSSLTSTGLEELKEALWKKINE